jgi:hypothetical protein
MTTERETISLSDYTNDRDYVVLFCAGVGCPMGDHFPLGYEHIDYAERRGLLDLTGTIGSDGGWNWDGEGNPTDDRLNSITKLQAFVSQTRWESEVHEYESSE